MKKITCIFICIVLVACVVSCSAAEKHGIDSFDVNDSESGLTQHLLPTMDDEFLAMFKYTYGDYHYYDGILSTDPPAEKVFMILEYEEAIYQEAKQYCIDNMCLSKDNVKTYNGYVFVENLAYPREMKYLKGQKNTRFPNSFCMLGYNDLNQSLIFIGFSLGETPKSDLEKKAAYAETDFGKFLDIFFSEYYDFNAK